jgi:hypothetical protein
MKTLINTIITGSTAILLTGCFLPPKQHKVSWDLNRPLSSASKRDSLKAVKPTFAVSISCTGTNATRREIANPVSYDYCLGQCNTTVLTTKFDVWHILETPQPLGSYVEAACSNALASQGIVLSAQAPQKLILDITTFKYIASDGKTLGAGVKRTAKLDLTLKVLTADGAPSYQRRIAVEAARKRGASSEVVGWLDAAAGTSVARGLRTKEEWTAATDTMTDLFAKLEDELVDDKDLLAALRK